MPISFTTKKSYVNNQTEILLASRATFNAAADTAGWATYSDSAGVSPVDGTAGSPASTWTRSTPSFLLTKSAANRQGEGVSYNFTIDAEDKAKVLTIEMDMSVSSGTFVAGTSTTSSDVTVWVYDVTNAVIIQPSNFKFFGNSSISEHYSGQFQTASNSTSYRLIIHIGSTSAVAYTLKFDDIKVTPSQYVYGSPVTDWQTYTPTGAWVSNTTYTGKWRRVGDSMEVQATATLSGAPTSTSVTFTIPTGYTIDTTKLSSATNFTQSLGSASMLDSGVKGWVGIVRYGNSTTTVFVYNADSVSADGSVTHLSPFTFGASDAVSVKFSVPITGWSSSVQMSDDADTRIVSATADAPNGQAVSASTETILNFDNVVDDSHSAITTGAGWKFTAPVSGFYEVSARVNYGNTSGVNTIFRLVLFKNGSSFKTMSRYVKPTGTFAPEVPAPTLVVKLRAGDYIHISANNDEAATTNNSGYVSIRRLSGPSAIAATETVAIRYQSSAGTSIANSGTDVSVPFATKVYDTHGSFDGTTFTAPAAGKYSVQCSIMYGSAAWAASNQNFLSLYKNGSAYQYSGCNPAQGAFTAPFSPIPLCLDVDLKAGETLSIYAAHNRTAGAATLHATAVYNSLQIKKIGN